MAIYKYWLPDHGETEAEARKVDSECRHARDIAGDAARHYHYHGNGLDAAWPLLITVQLQNQTERTFEVDREAQPVFFAVEVRAEGGR